MNNTVKAINEGYPSSPLTGNEPLFIVTNNASGNHDAKETRETIERRLSEAGRQHTLMTVDDGAQLKVTAEQALAQARAQGGIVVGGDVTLSAVSEVVLGSGIPMGILPQGTFNYFGRTAGISQKTESAIDALKDAVVLPVDVGLLNDRVFLVNASLRLYPQLLEDRETYKQRYGRSRLIALRSAIVTLAHAHRSLRVQIDLEGEPRRHMKTPTIVVGNNSLQLEQLGINRVDEIKRHYIVAMASCTRAASR
jgi:diacylglycerol kinase family enzyme